MMAAKGLVPVKGGDLVVLLAQLSVDPDVGRAATDTLRAAPENVLASACETALHGAVLGQLARVFSDRPPLLERLAANTAVPNDAIFELAAHCSEVVSDIIATNQERLIAYPSIIEALYLNRNTRMSTADRLIELAVRSGLELTRIPSFKDHAAAIHGTKAEPSEVTLARDAAFKKALQTDSSDHEAIKIDEETGEEHLKDAHRPLSFQISQMKLGEKIRLCMCGNAAARAILVRDPNRAVARAAISSPGMTELEATGVAHSKEVSDEVLRYIGNKKEWLRSYEIKRALLFNPKVPVGVSLKFVVHMRDNDLRALGKSRNVPVPIKTAAAQRLQKKGQK